MNYRTEQRQLLSLCAVGAGVILAMAQPESLAQTGADCTTSGTNLVGWWPADNHSYNVVNQRAATVQGTVTYTPGVAGNAFAFNGTGKVRIPEATPIDLSRTNRWTIGAWVRPSTLDGGASPTIYSEGNRVASLSLQKATGKLESWINGANLLASTVALPTNAWSHVALVLDRTTRTLYLNGVAAGTATGTPATTPDSTGSAIGGSTADDASSAFSGDIDELTLHRRALSAEEIAAIHAAGSAGVCYGGGGAPMFVIEPQPQTVPLFGDVNFFGVAMGSPRPTYQWFFKDSPLAGQTNLTLELKKVTPANDGIYKLVAVSGTQPEASAVAQLTVQHCVETPAGLVAWWPADGNGLEFTGNHDGEVWSGVTFPGGVAGQAFGFDGASGYVAVPDAPALSPHVGATGELTVEAWVYLSQLPQRDPYLNEDLRTVLAKGDSGRWEYLLRITTAGVVRFDVVIPSGATPYGSAVGGQVTLNRWHHLVGTLKKGQHIRLYQDGELMAESTTFSGDTADGGSPLYIGRRAEGGFFDGRVDEAAIYSRALSSDEIGALYAGGSVGKCYGGGPKPVFVAEPQDLSGYLLNSVTLEGMALGTPRPEYQWYHGDKLLDNATNSALSLANLKQADDGPYVLVASNRFGATQSRTITLTIVDYVTITEGFELGWNGWATDDYSIWQVGQPTSGPGTAHSGANCAATVLAGNYPEDRTARLVSPAFAVPAADQLPRLRFWHWWSIGAHDWAQVQIKVGTNVWQGLSESITTDSSSRWSRAWLDLTRYAGQTVQLGFYFESHNDYWGSTVGPGWYVDDLRIETGPPAAFVLPGQPEGFEGGWGGWRVDYIGGQTTDFGIWEIGVPTSGPGAAHSGANCAATVLAGNYPEDRSARLVSPAFAVPAADQLPRLRFWHWWSIGAHDWAQVQIKVGTNVWQGLSESIMTDSSSRWSRAWLDLTRYAGQTVQLGFYFESHNNYWGSTVGPGWYVDDLRIETGPPAAFVLPGQPEGFEGGWGGWRVDYIGGQTTDFGIWEIGVPTSGPGAAHSGTNCAATVLAGNYAEDRTARLVSPAFAVPAADQLPRLRFWHWWSIGAHDRVQVQIKVGTNIWQGLSESITADSFGRWSRAWLDLTRYAGQTVQLGFYFESHNDYWGSTVGPGWYVDDLRIETGPPAAFVLPGQPEGFEGGWGGWRVDYIGGQTTDFGIWEIGVPTSGPGAAHSGTNCAATVLAGNYPEDRTARLVSPAFAVPAADQLPRLRFWHWWSIGAHDWAQVQIKVGTNVWQGLSESITTDSSSRWSRAWLDLTRYAGQTVQLGFYFESHNDYWGSTVGPGWYVDDLRIETGPPAAFVLPGQPEGFEGGWGGWRVDYIGGQTTDFGIWEIGVPTSGPGAAHSGANCAATVLAGNYPEDRSARLVSPAFAVPTADQLPRLRFWHWWSIGAHDLAQVQIKVGTNVWEALSESIPAGSSVTWLRADIDLAKYAGQAVQLGFHFESHNDYWGSSVGPGWYVDDIMLQVGSIALAEVQDQTVDEKTPLSLRVNAVGANANSSLAFTLPWAPQGAWIDPETGVFSWLPGERQGPGVYNIPVHVVDYGNGEANEMTTVKITVKEVNERPWLLPAVLAIEPGQTLHFPLFAGDRDFPKNPLKYAMTGAPAGATLTADTGVLDWAVPANAQLGTYQIKVTLSDNASPNYTTNNTIALTVTANAAYGLSLRPLGGSDLEFTIDDTMTTEDYILQRATELADQASWMLNGDNVPAWVATLPEEDYLDWLSWDEFVQQRLQRTQWQDVVRVSPTQMPYSFVHKVPDIGNDPVGLFRLVRVRR